MIIPVALAAASSGDSAIKWSNFLLVFVVTLIAGVVISTSYSMGLRLLATESASTAGRAGAYVCFAIGVAAVLFGLWLVIPEFHSS